MLMSPIYYFRVALAMFQIVILKLIAVLNFVRKVFQMDLPTLSKTVNRFWLCLFVPLIVYM
jgi:hypothetical protein